MEESLDRKRERLDELEATRCASRRSMEENRREQQRLGRDIDLAVERGGEEIARMLMRNRLVLAETLRRFREEVRQVEDESRRMEETIRFQKLRLEGVKLRADAAARQREIGAPQGRCRTAPSDEEVELALMQWKTYSAKKEGEPDMRDSKGAVKGGQPCRNR